MSELQLKEIADNVDIIIQKFIIELYKGMFTQPIFLCYGSILLDTHEVDRINRN